MKQVSGIVALVAATLGLPTIAMSNHQRDVGPADTFWVDAEVVDEAGRLLVRLEGYATSPLPTSVDEGARELPRLEASTRSGVPRCSCRWCP